MATILITGANRGIGLSLARRLRARGDEVIAVCRRGGPALEATGAQVVDGVDVSDARTVAALPQRLAGRVLDTLILNAGIFTNETLDALDADAFARIQRQFEVNALGPLRVAAALQGQLAQGAKVGIVTSRMGSIADNGSGAYYGYRASKAAVNAIGRSLARDLAPRGIAVLLLHPGLVATEMVGGHGDFTPEEAAANLIARLDGLDLAGSGGFLHANGTPLPW
ncbi:short-chain dehydrogenase [Pseudoxanthomonas broegbernensis]|uniref:Short-chain dehydrogenase n=1 Tax=Pseudoxanthomonas broegbernensis TaxID=83619 RepID=A0A7V8GJZ9_9GAMM|nr:SDR family oxidoreductase [Pseudoxanthomonas broegbernensis]KAF1684644.1 short-chain dehydrogenase [Pseudoxanthomonas broegbernensis]MBB6063484.1 NAD(P)-dependent dehydrogenase (short-subunit alcohol dehydrogenase family) [Pseudoxanthomonas broegbernensis]